MIQPKVILASQSPQRRNLLATLGFEFEVIPADIDEKAIPHQTLELRAQNIAEAKAKKISKLRPSAIILAADTFVVMQEEVLEKPQTLLEAKTMLKRMSGHTIKDYTGVCFIDPTRQLVVMETVVCQATFRQLSEAEINRYIEFNPVLTWAAGFSPAYDAGMGLIASVNGSLTCLTHGLPLEKVTQFLAKAGIKF